jgi:hypothetical protein
MLPLSTTSKKLRAAGAFAALAVFFQSPSAFSSLNQFGLGVSLPQPFSSAGDTLNRPAGFTAEVEVDTPQFVPASMDFRIDMDYQPYSIKNLSSLPNSVQANVNMFGLFGGLQIWGGESAFHIRPFMAAEIGGWYDTLSFSNATNVASNASTVFAVKAVPGIDVPLFSHIGLMVELPIRVAFQQNTLAIWSSDFLLRWKL